MDFLDKLLDELRTKYNPTKPKASQPQRNVAPSFISKSPKSLPLEDSLLAEVRADFAELDANEELRKQEALKREKLRQAQLKSQKLVALQLEAETWLKTLDRFSSEGLWFARFAETYPSELEAAIAYLETNK
ncbi:hypothetical protein VB620_07425 [Nodularia harveyana UHCC-0300]|uniref:ATPase n=1 Tax=Nodularia harveyana UHCC-0300 TaxID=2974287 RepID=A0ABU5UCC5_9CYAN|nr:hypothetical protein [Nodularia harveyana]MEA5581167.1 hypothetical protein [Nodularia harveyana UHCC-0300]